MQVAVAAMTPIQIAILSGLGIVLVYAWLLWAIGPFRELNLTIGRFFFGLLPEKMQVVFTIPELRRKIFFTLGLLAIYRVGWQIPLPVMDPAQTGLAGSEQGLGGFLQQVSLFSASNLSQLTIFGLGIMPYISASIILQLLASVWAPLEKLQKEGETGRKKINEYTRYLTVVICLFQSLAFLQWAGTFRPEFTGNVPGAPLVFHWKVLCVLIMTCGTVFLMWLGEQIDEFGIGNGISLLIMAGILARVPGEMWQLLGPLFKEGLELGGTPGKIGVETLLVLIILFVAVVFGVVFITQGQRRIPTQSAKHVRGRRVFGGTRQYLPLRVNQSGVMPIIFASSLLLIPAMIFGQLAQIYPGGWFGSATWSWANLQHMFERGTSFIYNILYVMLIFFFCYFWTAITFNPKEMANNLKDFGSFIPGYRPGKRTADYLEKVMIRITYVGAAFLALVAVLPTIIYAVMGVDLGLASFYGGTSLLIAVSVAFDLCQKIDSHLVMRNYKGILEG
jgi:preprotein translocase subunit SecY